MASNYDSFPDPLSDEALQYYEIRPLEIHEFSASSSPDGQLSKFDVDMITRITARRPAGEELFCWSTFSLLLYTVRESPSEARRLVSEMLDAIPVGPQLSVAAAARLVDEILECCGRMACDVSCFGRVLSVSVNVDLLVDEIPPIDYVDEGFDEAELLGLAEYSDDFQLVPASELSIINNAVLLEKIRVSEKECCVVCLEDISAGSEATRLPCSHQFHGDCIVKWLNISKSCPLCRFELKSWMVV